MIPEYVRKSIAPVFTAFKENGEFDETGQRNFLDFLVQRGGISAFFFRCGLGQMFTFEYEDVQAIARTACSQLEGKAPVLVGTTGIWDRNRDKRPDPEVFKKQAVELSKYAEEQGAAAVVHTIPEALPTPEGQSHADVVYSYFEMVTSAVACPVFIYQSPGTDEAYCVTHDLIRRLADIPNLVAIKMSTVDGKYIFDMAEATTDKEFAVISGAETAFLPGLASGTKACIGQGCTVNPQVINAVQERFEAGDLAGAREAQRVTNLLVDRTSNCVEFMKRYATENGFPVGATARSMASNVYMKDKPALPLDEYESYKHLLESELADYL